MKSPEPRLSMAKQVVVFTCCLFCFPAFTGLDAGHSAVQRPILKWRHGGCYESWCEKGWYSSPALADLDGDGVNEVIGANSEVFILNGADGAARRMVNPEGGRVWPGVAVADIDGDGTPEILTAHNDGWLHVFDHHLSIEWSAQPCAEELRGLSVSDLDGDGTFEIIVTASRPNAINTWVYEHDGKLRAGWPQLVGMPGDTKYSWGVHNDNAAIGDMDGDGFAEIIVPSDVHYICAYESNGDQIPVNAIYGQKTWCQVGTWELPSVELNPSGGCEKGLLAHFNNNGVAVISDVNADGRMELVVSATLYDCADGYNPTPGERIGIFIFNADRSRFNIGPYNWETIPVAEGEPLSQDYEVIEQLQPNPAVADIDGDGIREIVYPAYDGFLHAFWLDKTEHHNWPYRVHKASDAFYHFASEAAIADLDDNGRAEVIFCSWPQVGSNENGKLHILDYRGNLLHEVPIPPPLDDTKDWNGGLAAPTIGNIDTDPDLEVVINTAFSGIVAFDIPGSAPGEMPWRTGRGGFWRNGVSIPALDVDGNGIVGLKDLIMALRIVAGAPPSPICMLADGDGDGRIGIREGIAILNRMAGIN